MHIRRLWSPPIFWWRGKERTFQTSRGASRRDAAYRTPNAKKIALCTRFPFGVPKLHPCQGTRRFQAPGSFCAPALRVQTHTFFQCLREAALPRTKAVTPLGLRCAAPFFSRCARFFVGKNTLLRGKRGWESRNAPKSWAEVKRITCRATAIGTCEERAACRLFAATTTSSTTDTCWVPTDEDLLKLKRKKMKICTHAGRARHTQACTRSHKDHRGNDPARCLLVPGIGGLGPEDPGKRPGAVHSGQTPLRPFP